METSNSEKKENLSFSELLLIEERDIPSSVSLETALKISNRSIDANEATGAEVFRLWVQKLLKVFTVTAADLANLAQCFENSLRKTLQVDIVSDRRSLNLDLWFADSCALLEWMQSGKSVCYALFGFLFKAVGECIEFHKRQIPGIDSSKLLQDALSLLNAALKALDRSVQSLVLRNEYDFLGYVQVNSIICTLEPLSVIDIKTLFRMHKCVAKLTIKLSGFATNQKEHNTQWAKKPFQLVLQKIDTNIRNLYLKGTLQLTEPDIVKYTKVTNFYLKLFHKMSSSLQHELFPVSKEFLNTFTFFQLMPPHVGDTKIADYVRNYLSKDMIAIFGYIYKSPDIRTLLVEEKTNLCMLLDYLEVVAKSSDIHYINTNADIFIKIFRAATKDPSIVVHIKYNTIVILYATLVLLSTVEKLKKFFILCVLQKGVHIAIIGVDILLVVSRYSHRHKMERTLTREMLFWRKCNDVFSLFSDSRLQCFVEHLLKNCCILNQSANNLNYSLPLPESSYRYLLVVASVLSFSEKQFLIDTMRSELKNVMHNLLANCTVADYYRMVFCIKLLSRLNASPVPELQAKISIVLQKILMEAKVLQKFARLSEACLEISLLFKPENVVGIFHCLKNALSQHRLAVASVPILNFFHAASTNQNQDVNGLAANFLRGLETQDISKIFRYLTEPNYIAVEAKCHKLNIGLYSNIDVSLSRQHICVQTKTAFPNSAKRSCVDVVNGEEDLKQMLNDIFEKSKKIVAFSQHNRVDHHDMIKLDSVVNNLKTVLNKNKFV